MTKKQYVTNDIVKFDYSEICRKSDDEMHTDTPLRNDEIVDLLNENEQLKQKYDNSVMLSARIQVQNDELKERNNRQAERLDELYSLIENENWKTLTGIIDEMNEAEELNRLEFEAYCGDR